MTSILKVSEIQDPTNSNTALTIDSTGRILTPARPAWRLGFSAQTSNYGAGTYVTAPFDVERILTGGVTHSAGVITVPVSGLYQINFTIRVDSIGTGYFIMQMLVNNTQSSDTRTYVIEQNSGANYHSFSGSDCFEVDANSTFQIVGYAENDAAWNFRVQSSFSGYLVG